MRPQTVIEAVARLHAIGEIILEAVILVETRRGAQREPIFDRHIIGADQPERVAVTLAGIGKTERIGILVIFALPIDRAGQSMNDV